MTEYRIVEVTRYSYISEKLKTEFFVEEKKIRGISLFQWHEWFRHKEDHRGIFDLVFSSKEKALDYINTLKGRKTVIHEV